MRRKNKLSPKDLYDYYEWEGEAGHHQRKIYSDEQKLVLMRKLKTLLKPIILKHIVLDVGCAEGWYTNWIGKESLLSVGIDISLPKSKRAIAESKSSSTTYVLGSWDRLPFGESAFDVILFSEGIEHAIDPLQTLSEFKRVLTKHGLLIISAEVELDNLYTKFVRERLMHWKNHFGKPFDGHLWIMTPNLLRELTSRYFQIEEEFLLGTPIDFPLKRTIARLVGKRTNQSIVVLLARNE